MAGSFVSRLPRGPLAVVAGVVVAALLVAGGGLLWWDQRPYAADLDDLDRPGAAAAPVSAGGASRSLAQLRAAVVDGDLDAARSLAPDGDGDAAERLAAVVDNAGPLAVRDLGLRYLDEMGPAVGAPDAQDGSWSAAVEVTWRFAGFDPAPYRVEVPVGFVRDGDRVAITRLGAPTPDAAPGGGSAAPRDRVRTPAWLAGPVDVTRDGDALVLVAREAADGAFGPEEYADLARAAVPAVAAERPDWDRRLVVEVPGGTEGLGAALGAPAAEVGGVAAVAASPDGSAGRGGVHVYVNPDVFDGLGPAGAQLVMTHEAVHVATRAPGSPAPMWMVEGYADFVALRGSGVMEATAAAQVAEEVRRDGAPGALPGPADFDTTQGRAGATYEAAWLACVTLADTTGAAGLGRVYDRLDGGDDVEQVLRDEAGFGVAELTRRWQQRLEALAEREPAA